MGLFSSPASYGFCNGVGFKIKCHDNVQNETIT